MNGGGGTYFSSNLDKVFDNHSIICISSSTHNFLPLSVHITVLYNNDIIMTLWDLDVNIYLPPKEGFCH